MNFIKRLTEEYGEYTDLIQPIQVAVYEMKLGLALALSASLQREFLEKIKEDGIEIVLVCIVLQLIVELYGPSISINNISKYMISFTLPTVKQ